MKKNRKDKRDATIASHDVDINSGYLPDEIETFKKRDAMLANKRASEIASEQASDSTSEQASEIASEQASDSSSEQASDSTSETQSKIDAMRSEASQLRERALML